MPQVSALSYGAWVTFGTQVDVEQVSDPQPRRLDEIGIKPVSAAQAVLSSAGQKVNDPMP